MRLPINLPCRIKAGFVSMSLLMLVVLFVLLPCLLAMWIILRWLLDGKS
jgi:hypothetical protein